MDGMRCCSTYCGRACMPWHAPAQEANIASLLHAPIKHDWASQEPIKNGVCYKLLTAWHALEGVRLLCLHMRSLLLLWSMVCTAIAGHHLWLLLHWGRVQRLHLGLGGAVGAAQNALQLGEHLCSCRQAQQEVGRGRVLPQECILAVGPHAAHKVPPPLQGLTQPQKKPLRSAL